MVQRTDAARGVALRPSDTLTAELICASTFWECNMQRIYASDLLNPSGDDHEDEHRACRDSFRHFLGHWRFVNRETGAVLSFNELWEGQARFVDVMETHRMILALKAGKLGFTELECAYDAWAALFGPPNARVHVFSKDEKAAVDLIARIRDGIRRLPRWMRRAPAGDHNDGTSRTTIRLRVGRDDVRTIVAYPASTTAAIDQTAMHSHVDELAHMLHPEETWNSIQTTIAPNGSCHIVTRGAGDDNYVATLWTAATNATTDLVPFFQPWTARPGRDPAWRELQAATLNMQGLLWFAPETPEDALAGAETREFLSPESWDACYDPRLPELLPGDPTPIVVVIDAAVTGDCCAVVAISRHPERHSEVAVRACRLWKPADFGGRIDLNVVERFIRLLCKGACRSGHPVSDPDPNCGLCRGGDMSIRPHKVVCVVYDPYQMEQMSSRLKGKIWMRPFPQGSDRLVADSLLHKLVLTRQLSHNGDPLLREHVLNARAKLEKDEDSRMRIVKKAADRRVDLAVAMSMGVKVALYLNI